MSRTGAVIKREFVEFVRTRTFLIATIMGPLLMLGIFGAQYLMLKGAGGGKAKIAIVDATGRGIGQEMAAALQARGGNGGSASGSPMVGNVDFTVEVHAAEGAAAEQARAELLKRISKTDLDGVLWLPPGLLATDTAEYQGRNATNMGVTTALHRTIQQAVQATRLAAEGIDQSQVLAALRPVRLNTIKTGGRGAQGSAASAIGVGFVMGFAIYLITLMYGAAVMNAVIEEKQDRVMELIVSSIRAKDLMLGKVVGIGAAGVLQMAIWVIFAAVLLAHGAEIASALGASAETVRNLSVRAMIPSVPLSAGIVFVIYFAGGFFLYATIYAVIGAISTTMKEAQQFVVPAALPLIIGFFMVQPTTSNPEGALAVAGSIIPFTSPMVMPVRVVIMGVSWVQLIPSVVLMLGTGLAIVWLGGKIYRIGIFSTGKRPSWGELWRWLRTA